MVTVMTVLPIGLVVMGTFMSLFGYFNVANVWTLRNWQLALSNPTFMNATANTIVLATGKAAFAMVVFTGIAYIAVRTRYAARGMLDMLVWLP
jgi:ABC-type spermidine/putrescine transport system permease subunit II